MQNVAIFGAGRIGRIHGLNVHLHPELKLSHVVDPSQEAAEALAQATGASVCSLDDALGDSSVTGVIVASSTDSHLEHCLRSHRAGKVIFCEKPIDLDLARARSAAEELGDARLFLGFNRRFDPNFSALKDRISGGSLGVLETLQITSNDPGPPPVAYIKTSGGLFKDMSIHDFDMARWLLDDDLVAVFAWGSVLVEPAIGAAGDIDTARVMLKSASGKMCVIANSRRSGFGYDQRIEAYCAKGLANAANVTESTVQVWTQDGAKADRFQNFFLDRYAMAYRAEIDHFADMLIRSADPQIGYRDGIGALVLAEAAAQSLATGLPVQLV